MLEFLYKKISHYLVFVFFPMLILIAVLSISQTVESSITKPTVVSSVVSKPSLVKTVKTRKSQAGSKNMVLPRTAILSINKIIANLDIIKPEQKKGPHVQQQSINISNFPVKGGHISSGFGIRKDPIHGMSRMHKGLDIAAKESTFVYPLGKGKVIFSGYKPGYGNTVEIQHGNTVVTRYAHLEMSLIDVGRDVDQNDIIALVGNTGRSTGPHLHLELAFNGEVVDPEVYLAKP